MPSTPTKRRKRLGAYLAKLRDDVERTADDAAELLHKRQSQVSKIELGYVRPAHAEMVALLAFYGADKAQRDHAETLWNDAGQDSRRIQGSSAVPPKFRAFLRNEAEADSEDELNRITVPGMLQTPRFAKASRAAGHRIANPNVGEERATAARIARQDLLRGSSPIEFRAVVDQAVIAREVGGRDVMAEQLAYILETMNLGNVNVHIVPFGAGAYGGMSGSFTILGYSAPEDPDTVYCEYEGGGDWFDTPSDVEKFKLIFEDAKELALSSAESAALIEQTMRKLEGR
jgi:hypothetical protein